MKVSMMCINARQLLEHCTCVCTFIDPRSQSPKVGIFIKNHQKSPKTPAFWDRVREVDKSTSIFTESQELGCISAHHGDLHLIKIFDQTLIPLIACEHKKPEKILFYHRDIEEQFTFCIFAINCGSNKFSLQTNFVRIFNNYGRLSFRLSFPLEYFPAVFIFLIDYHFAVSKFPNSKKLNLSFW